MVTNFWITGTDGTNAVNLVVTSTDAMGSFEAGVGVGLAFIGLALAIKIVSMIRGGGGFGDS